MSKLAVPLLVALVACGPSGTYVPPPASDAGDAGDATAAAAAEASAEAGSLGAPEAAAEMSAPYVPPEAQAPAPEASTSVPEAGPSQPDSVAPPACAATPARGVAVAYQEYEAEDAATNGTILGPSRAVNDPALFNSIAGESSGRRAVQLGATGQYVRFNVACAANGLVVRYALPDSADGAGQTATLGVYVNGTRVQSLNLTSRYAWAYGNPATSTTTTNNAADGYARHFYDEARLLFQSPVPAGATLTLQRDASDSASYYVIDLVDLEQVPPPLSQPAGSLSLTDYGAVPNDGVDDGSRLRNCVMDAQAQGKTVWIPPGVFDNATMPLSVHGVAIRGAGMWYSTLRGPAAHFYCAGGPCQFSDISLTGDVTTRDDTSSIPGLGGTFSSGARIDNVWIEHFTTGAWIGVSGAVTSGLVIHGCRIRDLFADGINLTNGTSNTTVEQTNARNTGDDAFASWSVATAPPNTNDVFRFDTAQLPWRANCFGLYGGTGNAIEDSVCADVVTYPGVLVQQGFSSNSFGGTTTLARDTLLRAGGNAYGARWGALTVSGFQQAAPITGVQVQDLDIDDSTFSGIFITGPKDAINALGLSNVTIRSPATFGIAIDSTAVGSATATNVVVSQAGTGGLDNQAPASWSFNRVSGNTGW